MQYRPRWMHVFIVALGEQKKPDTKTGGRQVEASTEVPKVVPPSRNVRTIPLAAREEKGGPVGGNRGNVQRSI